jgi:hypothetical protein
LELDRAREAMSRAWADAKAHLANGVDPRAWAGEHPWIALAGAAAAGFVAAVTLVPSKEEQALKKLAALERALSGVGPDTPVRSGDEDPTGSTTVDPAATRARHGWVSTIGLELIRTLRPALVSALTAGITAKTASDNAAARENDPARSNGHGPEFDVRDAQDPISPP